MIAKVRRETRRYDSDMASIRLAQFDADAEVVRTLMREYAHFLNSSVGGEHICVESLEEELAGLPGSYAEPAGAVLLAFEAETPAGFVALKPLQPWLVLGAEKERACEMKRLWVRPGEQGTGLGRRLGEEIMEAARARGYTAMYLDTMPESMQAAYRLYCCDGVHTGRPLQRESGAAANRFS